QISYNDTQAATTTFVVARHDPGKRQGKRCVTPTRKLRRARSCTILKKLGSFKHKDVVGGKGFTFSGRINGRKLKKGAYRLTATPRNNGGLSGAPFIVEVVIK